MNRIWGLLVCAAGSFADAQAVREPMPPGVGIAVTVEGPVFTDPRGMTLYFGPGAACTAGHQTRVKLIDGGGVNWKTPVEIDLPLSCVEKTPPFPAAVDSKPVGRWTLIERADGTRQWAYGGHPLHMSIKDVAPGDINGSYRVRVGSSETNASPAALAPMPGLPDGLTVRETAAGLVFANASGKTLYFGDPNVPATDGWRPVFAPAFVNSTGFSGEWSIATGAGGARQWAYKGHPLYTYAYDSEGHGGQLLGDTYGSIWGPPIKGWQVAVAKAAPRHPAEVTVQQLPGTWEQFNTPLPGTVYADRQGFTLYTVHCRRGRDSVTCDDVGDDPRYWLSFCGGEQQCAQTWHPLLAPAQAHAIDGVWSVVAINPTNPFLEAGRGVRVWAYRGRPVFTYARDRLPGDFYGDDQSFAISGDGMQARPIPAYERSVTARPPVMALQR